MARFLGAMSALFVIGFVGFFLVTLVKVVYDLVWA